MNFKTTIVLLVLLVGMGIAVWIANSKKAPEAAGDKLMQVESNDVTGVLVRGQNSDPVEVQRHDTTQTTQKRLADGTMEPITETTHSWSMLQPAKTGAVDMSVMDFVRSIVSATVVDRPQGVSASDAGLDSPQYQIELTTTDGKVTHLNLGKTSSLGDRIYAQVDGGDIDLIDASILKGAQTTADDFRDKHLFSLVKQPDIHKFTVTNGKAQIGVAKWPTGEWKLTQPSPLPGDSDAVDQYLSDILGTQATAFLKSDSGEVTFADFDHPTAVVRLYAAMPPAATTQPAPDYTMVVGGPDGPAKTNYFVRMGDGQVGKISADALKALTKTELDLRDKNVLMINPEEVTQIKWVTTTYLSGPTGTTATRPAATAPAKRPTMVQTVILRRRPVALKTMGPEIPATLPSTLQSTLPSTNPSTRPSTNPSPIAVAPPAPQSEWQYVTPFNASKQVDDNKVNNLLQRFGPEHANSFFATAPAWLPAQQITLTFSIQPPGQPAYETTIDLFSPSDQTNKPYGELNGTFYEVDPLDLTVLQGDFLRP